MTNGKNPDRIDIWPQPVPVSAQGLPGNLAVVGDGLGTVKLQIEAPEKTWAQLSLSEVHAYVNLAGALPGFRLVPVKVEVTDPNVIVRQIIPPEVSVRIEAIDQKTVPVQVDVQGAVAFGYSSAKAVPSQDTATVSGPTSLLANVVAVDATVRIDGAKATISSKVKLVPKNSQGGDVTDPAISVSPQSVEVTVPVKQQVTYKTASVVPVITGTVATGYQVGAVTTTPNTVTVLGSPTVLDPLTSVQTGPVTIQGAIGDIVRSVTLSLPKGVTLVENTSIQVTVHVAPISGTLTFAVAPRVVGLAAHLRLQHFTPAVSVVLAGSVPSLAQLTPTNIVVTVDASGLGPGSYALAPSLSVPKGFRVVSVAPAKVSIAIAAVPTPTPTPRPPTPTPRPTPTPLPAPTPSPAASTPRPSVGPPATMSALPSPSPPVSPGAAA